MLKIHLRIIPSTRTFTGASMSITFFLLIRPSVTIIITILTQLFPNNYCTSQVTLFC